MHNVLLIGRIEEAVKNKQGLLHQIKTQNTRCMRSRRLAVKRQGT